MLKPGPILVKILVFLCTSSKLDVYKFQLLAFQRAIWNQCLKRRYFVMPLYVRLCPFLSFFKQIISTVKYKEEIDCTIQTTLAITQSTHTLVLWTLTDGKNTNHRIYDIGFGYGYTVLPDLL